MVKNWSDGDFLYGSDMDEIATSGVMRFATKAARDSTLVGDLAPRAGMMVYTDDDKQTREYVVVSSTGYWAPRPGTLVAYAVQTVAQSLASVTYTPLTLGTLRIERLGVAITSGTRYLPNVPGWYTAKAWLALNAASGLYTATVYKKGATIVGAYGASVNTNIGTVVNESPPATVYMDGVADYFEAVGRHSATASVTTVVTGFASGLSVTYEGQ